MVRCGPSRKLHGAGLGGRCGLRRQDRRCGLNRQDRWVQRWFEAAARKLPWRRLHRQQRVAVGVSADQVLLVSLRKPELVILIAKLVGRHCRIRPERKRASYFRVGSVAEYLFLAETAFP